MINTAMPINPPRINKIVEDNPPAEIATLRTTVERMNPVLRDRFVKSIEYPYEISRIRISARISTVKKSRKKISLVTEPSPSLIEIHQLVNENSAMIA